jgi:hypothetical protein
LTGFPLLLFLPGLILGSAVDLGLHFAIGYAGSSLLAAVVQPAPLLVIVLLALVGLTGWFAIARRRRLTGSVAVNAWVQATCPVCLAIGGVASLEDEPAVRWSGAA